MYTNTTKLEYGVSISNGFGSEIWPTKIKINSPTHQCLEYSLLVGVESRVGEALALVLPEEHAVAQADVVHLIAGAATVNPLPLLRRLLALSAVIIMLLHAYYTLITQLLMCNNAFYE